MKQPIEVPESLVAATQQGLTNPGQFYLTNKPFQLAFIINAALAWRQRSLAEREALLGDPWAFKAFLTNVPEDRGIPKRLGFHPFAKSLQIGTIFISMLAHMNSHFVGGPHDARSVLGPYWQTIRIHLDVV